MTSHPKRGPGRAPRNQAPAEGAASAPIVFAILVTVVAAIAGAALVLRSTPTEQPATAASPGAPSASPTDLSLTNEEAIERFEQLDDLRLQLFRDPETADISSVFAPDGPAARRVQRALRELKRRDAFLTHPLYRTQQLKVVRNDANHVEIRHVVVLRTRVRSRSGEDLADDRRKRQTVLWILKPSRTAWFIHDGSITSAKFTEPIT